MKYLTIFVLFCVVSAQASNVEIQETGWRGVIRPYVVYLLGEETTNSLIGSPLIEVNNEISLPVIPQITKSATDLNSINKNESNPNQGLEYLRQPKEKIQAYDLAFIQELFWATRRSKPTDEDVSKWMNAIEQGASREGVYRALVLDEVYATLESYDDKPQPELVKFMLEFSQEFTGLTYQETTLKNANLFMIKRILVEKVLELMDEFEKRPDELFRWYAVVSARLAKDFKTAWNNPLRSDVDAKRHYRWAQAVPFQAIKSELILKIHFAMNSLQKN